MECRAKTEFSREKKNTKWIFEETDDWVTSLVNNFIYCNCWKRNQSRADFVAWLIDSGGSSRTQIYVTQISSFSVATHTWRSHSLAAQHSPKPRQLGVACNEADKESRPLILDLISFLGAKEGESTLLFFLFFGLFVCCWRLRRERVFFFFFWVCFSVVVRDNIA
jgi:hypothetical protein